MSTIEKAAARLVKKPKATSETHNGELEKDGVKAGTQASAEWARDLGPDAPGPVRGRELDVDDTAPHAGGQRRSEAFHSTCELDFPGLAKHGFLVPGHDNARQNQEFRRIKRPLLLNMQPQIADSAARPPNLIFCTSALPGEGKTFVALNLALSLAAEIDRKVLLVDGDAAKGDMSRWLGIHGEPGLVDLLRQGSGYGEGSIIETNLDRLSVMPCGERVENLNELYASELMGELLDGLASFDDARIVVIDGPPLIATTEAVVLAHQVGQVLMIVEASKTPHSAVSQAMAQLDGCNHVSLLLNKSAASGQGDYGYGYGYGQNLAS